MVQSVALIEEHAWIDAVVVDEQLASVPSEVKNMEFGLEGGCGMDVVD